MRSRATTSSRDLDTLPGVFPAEVFFDGVHDMRAPPRSTEAQDASRGGNEVPGNIPTQPLPGPKKRKVVLELYSPISKEELEKFRETLWECVRKYRVRILPAKRKPKPKKRKRK